MCAFSYLELENVSVIKSYRRVVGGESCRRWNHQKTLMHRAQLREGCGLSWPLTVMTKWNSPVMAKARLLPDVRRVAQSCF